MRSSGPSAGPDWRFIHFGLIVTGETEKRCLPYLFRSMTATGRCSFSVIRRIGQRSPIRSDRRRLKMVGSGKTIPDRDVTEIGLPSRHYVETIRNPKDCMKTLHPGFDTVADGCRIIGSLAISHVLSRRGTCTSLRTLFAWVYKAIGEPDCELRQHLVGGYDDVTKGQICALSP